MTTNTELIARLRETYPATYCFTDIPHIAIEAADAIEALESRLKSAEDLRQYYSDYCNLTAKERDALQAQLAAAQGQEPICWVVPHYGFTFPTEEAAQQYQDNLECIDKPIPCYAAPIPQQPAEPALFGKELTKQTSAALADASNRSFAFAKQMAESRASAIAAAQQAQPEPKMVTPYISQEHFDRVFPVNQAQPERAPLSIQEIADAWGLKPENIPASDIEAVREIEAAHGIKQGGQQ